MTTHLFQIGGRTACCQRTEPELAAGDVLTTDPLPVDCPAMPIGDLVAALKDELVRTPMGPRQLELSVRAQALRDQVAADLLASVPRIKRGES